MHVILLILLNRSRDYNFSIKSSMYKMGLQFRDGSRILCGEMAARIRLCQIFRKTS